MLAPVELGQKRFTEYSGILDPKLIDSINLLSKRLAGAKILNINTTARGGGVAQILQSSVPLLRDLGIAADWQLVNPVNPAFFIATKKIHNSLQGGKVTLSKTEWQIYEEENRNFVQGFDTSVWDYIIIHDPQPAAMLGYASRGGAKWVWRCHIDLSRPNQSTRRQFLPYLKGYDGAIFTLKDYILSGLDITKVAAIPVAIDPLTDKNHPLSLSEARDIVAGYGIDINKPLIVQISRFDPWKDPLGVIKAWSQAKQLVPALQLVLMGDAADDDPEGKGVLDQVLQAIEGRSDVFIVTDTNDLAVNAFQTVANVVLQKSIREGFGLTVTEALWAKTPVIGGKVGGIPIQIKEGKNGYLVTSSAQAARRIVDLVNNPLRAKRMGQWGHEYVRRHFLLPHMIRDELKFLLELN